MANQEMVVSIVLVGCGCPLRSMGWYHAVQIMDGRLPRAKLTHVVEPWYMSEKSKGTPGYAEFHEWRAELENLGVSFYETVQEVPPPQRRQEKNNEGGDGDGEDEIRLCIISARTADNPALFEACVHKGCTAIYLEKPGAPTVSELETMKAQADTAGIQVFMGFNKNVSSYVTQSRAFASQDPSLPCDITFWHNNNYPKNSDEALAECFERNAEGMLKNMAIHELAILATYYGVTVDTIESVTADTSFSKCVSLAGPSSGTIFTDFVQLKFKIITTSGAEVHVAADRCGGDDSVGIVTERESGKEVARFTMPDDDTVSNIPSLKIKYGNAMPYFFAQDPDYLKLKSLVVSHLLGDSPASEEGIVATIDIAIDTLKVAEYLTPILQDQLK